MTMWIIFLGLSKVLCPGLQSVLSELKSTVFCLVLGSFWLWALQVLSLQGSLSQWDRHEVPQGFAGQTVLLNSESQVQQKTLSPCLIKIQRGGEQ